MSLRSDKYKGSYNRAKDINVVKERVHEMNASVYDDPCHSFCKCGGCMDRHPSVADIRYGWLLSLLSDLRFYKAKSLLKHWYW